MIEINLLPGAAKKNKGRGPGFSIRTVVLQSADRIRDPYMIAAVAAFVISASAIGGMHLRQSGIASGLAVREEKGLRDSTRFAMVLKERGKAEANRDSVVRQLQIIRSIDNDRFVWPHILDEVSRALPPYTWLKSISQTASDASGAAGGVAPAVAPAPAAPPGSKRDAAKKSDPEPSTEPLRFQIVGNTVDIQALTRFMKLLELSPYVQNVQLARSEMVVVDGKEITEFQLEAEYERPEKSLIATAPVSLSVR